MSHICIIYACIQKWSQLEAESTTGDTVSFAGSGVCELTNQELIVGGGGGPKKNGKKNKTF